MENSSENFYADLFFEIGMNILKKRESFNNKSSLIFSDEEQNDSKEVKTLKEAKTKKNDIFTDQNTQYETLNKKNKKIKRGFNVEQSKELCLSHPNKNKKISLMKSSMIHKDEFEKQLSSNKMTFKNEIKIQKTSIMIPENKRQKKFTGMEIKDIHQFKIEGPNNKNFKMNMVSKIHVQSADSNILRKGLSEEILNKVREMPIEPSTKANKNQLYFIDNDTMIHSNSFMTEKVNQDKILNTNKMSSEKIVPKKDFPCVMFNNNNRKLNNEFLKNIGSSEILKNSMKIFDIPNQAANIISESLKDTHISKIGMSIETSFQHGSDTFQLNENHSMNLEKEKNIYLKVLNSEEINQLVDKLMILFLEKEPVEIIQLNKLEKVIIALLIFKKLKQNIELHLIHDLFIKKVFGILTKKSFKRPEEKLKFVFKRSFKNLLTEYEKLNPIIKGRRSTKQTTYKFIEYHYQDISKNQNLDISYFYPPNRQHKHKKSEYNKTLSLEYLSRLSQNPIILAQMISFIDNEFFELIRKEMKNCFYAQIKKINQLVNSVCNQFQNISRDLPSDILNDSKQNKEIDKLLKKEINSSLNIELEKVSDIKHSIGRKDIFEKSKEHILKFKMKIPWTISEIENAMAFVRKKLSKIQNQANK